MNQHVDLLDRMVAAVERVRERMLRAAHALEAAGIPFAVAGGNAVAAWVATVDDAAVRNTRNVDILLRREDLDRAKVALEGAGFTYRRASGIDMFIDRDGGKARDAVHILIAGEKVRPEYSIAAPDAAASIKPYGATVPVVALQALVEMKLVSNRLKDQVHVLDMLSVGLIDGPWAPLLPPELGERLQYLIDHPDI